MSEENTAPAPEDLDTPVEPTPPVAEPAAPVAVAEPPVEPAGDWPADWRQKYSEDPKVLKRLERYASPKAALDALFAAQSKISEKGTRLKAEATPEEVAAWRSENGIPDTPEGYDLKEVANGLIVGDADRPLVDDFLKAAHEANMHPSEVKKTMGWYFSKQEEAIAQREARDLEVRLRTEDDLRAEYGSDYRRNLKVALEVIPADIKDQFLSGRLADGTLIGDNPVVIRWLTGMARELNPMATVVPGSGVNAMQAVESELNNMKKMMADSKSDYWVGPQSAKMQTRYRELVDAVNRAR